MQTDQAFLQGLQNDRSVKEHGIGFAIRLLVLQVIASLLTSRRCERTGKDLLCVNGFRQERLAKEFEPDESRWVAFGRSSARMSGRSRGPLAGSGLLHRFLLWFRAIALTLRSGSGLSNLGFAVEFLFLHSFINRSRPQRITAFGHYDRYSTWLSVLCHKCGVPFRIIQHGALSEIEIPNRLWCDELVCFNSEERELFQKCVIHSTNCQVSYRIPGGIAFAFCSMPGAPKIAIASQAGFTHKTLEVLDYLDCHLKGASLILYRHHLEPPFHIAASQNGNNILVAEGARHYNVDAVITFFSSIVYDYLYCDQFNGKIICLPIKGIRMAFYDNPRVHCVQSCAEMEALLPLG